MATINQLNYTAYKELKDLCNELSLQAINPWFEQSYPAFVNHPIKEQADLIRVIAYAYSWMPTIPNINFRELKNEEQLFSNLQLLQSGEGYNLKEILSELVPVINNSIVGTSKVLHFIAPDKVAIIDSRVVRAWNRYFSCGEIKFPYSFTKHNIGASIDAYLQYNHLMNEWLNEIKKVNKNHSLRDIEFLLYALGAK